MVVTAAVSVVMVALGLSCGGKWARGEAGLSLKRLNAAGVQ
jgi:hypothetical protein